LETYQWLDELLDKEMPNMTEKKKAIVKASIILFNEKGYSATSTKEIAKMAGVSEGTIFKHFTSKRELMLALIDIIINEMLLTMFYSGLPEIVAKEYDDLDEFLTVLVKNRLQLLEKGVPLFKILIQELPFHKEIRDILMQKISKIPIEDLLSSLSIRGLGSLKPADEIVLILVTCFGGFVQSRYILMPEYFNSKPGYDREKDMISFIHFVVRGLLSPEK
jgi:AcrR family transcriptional regulator